MLKSIRAYTVILFILLIASCAELHSEVIKPYVEKLNVENVYKRLANVSGTTRIPPLILLESEMVNAWTDGRSITITTGLLKIMKNNHELAMVLGHELGHYVAGDVHRNDIDPRYMEANADKFGAFVMMRAGFDECLGKEIMRTFKELYGDDAATTDHPDNAFRLDQLDLPQCNK